MSDKKTLLLLVGIMLGTLALIFGFAFLVAQPAKPAEVDIIGAPFLGPKDAKVTVVEFSDFSCSGCEAFATQILPELKKQYKNTVKFVYRFFPLYEIHNLANLSAQSAYCAGKQNKFWEYHDLLMSNADKWQDKPDQLQEYAKNLKLNIEDFNKCQASGESANAVAKGRQQGESLGVDSTPTFFVNGEKVVGLQSLDTWKKILDGKLK